MSDEMKEQNEKENMPDVQDDSAKKREDNRKRMQAELFSWIRYFAVAIIAALVVRYFIFTPALVKGPSMQDTLYTNQLMAVIRPQYWFREPKRGEVVFCRYPDWNEDCVKRVIGLPGERVRIQDNIVYINDVPLDEPYLTKPETRDFDEITVGEDAYFVIGDNRGNSTDSRAVGALERKQIEGWCVAVFWPISDWKVIR